MSIKTQKETVLSHLKKHKKISSWEAIQAYHITRLADIIFRLRNEGYNILSTRTTSDTGKNFVRYTFMGKL
jgi:hypothetical protein